MSQHVLKKGLLLLSAVFSVSCQQDSHTNLGVEDANAAVKVMSCVHSQYVSANITNIANDCSDDINVLIVGNGETAQIAAQSSAQLNSVNATGFVACRVPFKPKVVTAHDFYCEYKS